MAKKALVEKANRKPKFKVRAYTRCKRCGRARATGTEWSTEQRHKPASRERRAQHNTKNKTTDEK